MVLGFDFDRLRSGSFEGPAIIKPPALRGDTDLEKSSRLLVEERMSLRARSNEQDGDVAIKAP
jgi:hypothetical protein